MSGLDAAAITAIYDAVVAHAQSSCLFSGQVGDHEPETPPGTGLTCAVLLGPLGPAKSGLNATSGRLELSVRIYSPRTALPSGGVDQDALAAACTLMAAYSGDFELAGVPDKLVRCIDLLGAYGAPMAMTPGWLIQDGTPYRVMDITVPVILNDIWGQT